MNLWAAEWNSKNKLDGIRKHIIYVSGVPLIFKYKKDCKDWINKHYGYIKRRKDLRDEPHGWRMPKEIKIIISKK